MQNAPGTRTRRMQRSAFVILSALTLTLSIVAASQSAYQGRRPVSNGDGQILQTYLWATEFGTEQHRGLDFPNTFGTDVLAVADGVVVDLEEGIPDGTFPGGREWGNFVLIRHSDGKNYDQTTGSNAYVYTIYAHLSQLSVIPDEGDTVTAGTHIADIDDTGNSSGHHLHLQVVLNPSTDLDNIELEPVNTLDSENRSRNPELWLTPYPGTGAAIGKVTDTNGAPVANLVVCGIEKNAPTTGYVSSRTYSFPAWANPDDILHENFGTTDVAPGTYFLYAANRATGCGGAHVYDLGNHTFSADRVTYVGLYPFWLPVVKPSTSLWDAQIFIRNHASGWDSVSYTTFYRKYVEEQLNRTTDSQGTAVVADEPHFAESAIVVPNQDSSVVVVANRDGQPAGYSGISATHIKDSVIVSPGWERPGSTLYVPLVKDSWVGRSSQIYITNVGMRDTQIDVSYYTNTGTIYPAQQNLTLRPNDRTHLNPTTYVPNNGFYSAKITNNSGYNQPLAAVVLEQGTTTSSAGWPAMYNAFSSGGTTLYAPLIKKNYAGNTTGITLQNISSSTANFEARYYDMDGNQQGQTVTGSIPANGPFVLYNPSQIPDGFLGSVRITATNGSLVGQMSEGNGDGGLRLMSNLALGGTDTIHLPLWYDNYAVGGSWMSGVNVRNTYSASHVITATWYNQNGTPVHTQTATLINSNDTHNFYDTSLTNFIGSVVITSNTDRPVVAVSNARNWAGTAGTDVVFAFNGSNR